MKIKLKDLKCESVNVDLDEYLEFYNDILNNMERKEFLGTFSKKDMEFLLKNGSNLWVYKNDNEIVCSILYIPSSEKSMKKLGLDYDYTCVGEIGPVMVNKKYVGNSLQYQMLKVLYNYCKKLNKKYIITTVHPENVYCSANFLKDNYIKTNSFVFGRGPRDLYIKKIGEEKRIIFIDGLPGVGKTTIVNEIKKMNLKDIHVVDEIINKAISDEKSYKETDYIKNDEMKISKYDSGKIVIDRSPISSLSYCQAKNIINSTNKEDTIKWFNTIKNVFNKNTRVIYLTNKGKNYKLSVNDNGNPYGTAENQKLLEKISLNNVKKYANNYKVIEYHQDNMGEIINEIIN